MQNTLLLLDLIQVVEVNTREALKSANVVGIYFSGSWCQPCKRFTPLLVTFYERMKQKNNNFEIVLVSYDRTEDDFLSYFEKMPWYSLVLNNIPTFGNKLSEMYRVEGIPSLVILEGDDLSVITTEGTSKVSADTYGLEFPWRSRKISAFVPRPMKAFMRQNYNALMTNKLSFSPGKVITRMTSLSKKCILKLMDILTKNMLSLTKRLKSIFWDS